MAEKKKTVSKKRPEKYEKSELAINGSFDEAMKVFFVKPESKSQKTKEK